jgi:hypothetical protein
LVRRSRARARALRRDRPARRFLHPHSESCVLSSRALAISVLCRTADRRSSTSSR